MQAKPSFCSRELWEYGLSTRITGTKQKMDKFLEIDALAYSILQRVP
jgi:hypothetical protein